MDSRFEREAMLIGEDSVELLGKSCVALFGVGGVGSYAAEALARCGVGKIVLIDHDRVSKSNINRQLCALESTVGSPKVQVVGARLRDINPNAEIVERQEFFLPENSHEFDFSEYVFVIDAIDTVSGKLEIARLATESGTPMISCMGTGNKLDPTAFRVTDISKTSVCPLARTVRTLCRKHGIKKLRVLWSDEEPSGSTLPDANGRNVPGSISFVPSVAGLMIAGEVVRTLAAREQA